MKALPLALFIVCFPMLVFGVDDPRFSDKAAAESKKRSAVIRAEIAAMKGDSWAGEYYFGDGLGVNATLLVGRKAGFVFEWHGCGGLYDRNYGAVRLHGREIDFESVFENNCDGFRGFAPALLPVHWGGRHYLVPADRVVDFCNLVNSGQEPRSVPHGVCFIRKGDEKLPVTGKPELPEKYAPYLLDQPIRVRVVKVGKLKLNPKSDDSFKMWTAEVALDRGSDAGLLAGMELSVILPAEILATVRVADVQADGARGEATIYDGDPKPSTAWKLSTGNR